MVDIWLRNNTRALLWGTVPPGGIALAGLVLLAGGLGEALWLRVVGGLLTALGAWAVAMLVWQMRQPRVAYEPGYLLVYLTAGPPYRVPIEIVECFLLGRGPSLLPTRQYERREAHTVVIRLDEEAAEWSHRETKPALGSWCGNQITIRGTWCEPLDVDLVRRLNAQLADATRQARQARVSS